MTLLAILFLILAIGCYSISQLIMHDKLRWASHTYDFWDTDSWRRKYAGKWEFRLPLGVWEYEFKKAPDNWYYKHIARVKYKERWFTSTWLTVAFTDGYHASQSVSFICLAGSLSLFSGYSFWWFWIGIVGLHAAFYRIFSK